jgi:hypothetical protein
VRTRYSFAYYGHAEILPTELPPELHYGRCTFYVGYDSGSEHTSEDFDPYVESTFDFMVVDNIHCNWSYFISNEAVPMLRWYASGSTPNSLNSQAQRSLSSFQPHPFVGFHVSNLVDPPIEADWAVTWTCDMLYDFL